MQLNSLSTVGIATQVWVQATRTLTNPTGVWADATRTLTTLGTGAVTFAQTNNGSLATSTILDLRPAAGIAREVSVAIQSGAAGSALIGYYDGVTFVTGVTVAPTSSDQRSGHGNSTVGLSLKAGGNNAAPYSYVAQDWNR